MADKTIILRLQVSGFGEASRDLEFLTNETTKLVAQKARLTTESKAAARAITAEEGSIEKLRAETALLRQQANQMKAVNEQEIKTRDQLTQKIAENTAKIRDHDRAMSGSSTLVGEYEKGFSAAFGKIGASIAAVGGIIAGVYTAFQTFKQVLESTGATADRFEEIIQGIKQGFDQVKRAVATLDFKDFVKNVKAAIDEGQRYAAGLDDIDDKTRGLKIAEAEGRNELLKQREIQNDVRKSLEERNKAGKEAIAIEERLQVIRTGIAEQGYLNELDNLTKIANIGKSINDDMRNEILLYVRRDEEFMKGFVIGEEYNAQLREKTKLDGVIQAQSLQGIKISESQRDRQKQLNELLTQSTDYQRQWGEVAARVTLPTDEKYALLTEKIVELEGAKGSALENTIRVRTRAAGIENQYNKEFAEGQLTVVDATKAMKYNADEWMKLQEEIPSAPEMFLGTEDDWEKQIQLSRQMMAKGKEDASKYFAELIELEYMKLEAKQEISDAEINIIYGVAGILSELSGKNKALATTAIIISRIAAIAQIISQTAIANAKAVAASPLTNGQPWVGINTASAIVSAALVIAEASTSIGKIGKYASGGRIIGGLKVTPDLRGDDTVIVAREGEAVINESQQARLGGAAALKRAGVPGFADGGLIGSVSYSPGNSFDMDMMISKMSSLINSKEVVLNLHKLDTAQKTFNVITQAESV
jgi:hypothetical protein